jgi:hypothetical protein
MNDNYEWNIIMDENYNEWTKLKGWKNKMEEQNKMDEKLKWMKK